MDRDRDLDWEGSWNVRDLGGLATRAGGRTRWNAIVRADNLGALTTRGWEQALEHGVRTVVDLRNPDEKAGDLGGRPGEIATISVPLDVIENREFWDELETSPSIATPLYYRSHIDRFASRSAEAITAIADAPEGAVAVHCMSGRDRTGQITMLTLALAGVADEEVVADYERSIPRLNAKYSALAEEDQNALVAGFLTDRETTFAAIIAETLTAFDLEAHLGAAGLSAESVQRLRERLTQPA